MLVKYYLQQLVVLDRGHHPKLSVPDVFPISRRHGILHRAVAGTANFAVARQEDIGWGTLENRGHDFIFVQ